MKTVTNNNELNTAFQTFFLIIGLSLLYISIEVANESWDVPDLVYTLCDKAEKLINELKGDEPKPVDVDNFSEKVNLYISELDSFLSSENTMPEPLKKAFEDIRKGFQDALDSFYI